MTPFAGPYRKQDSEYLHNAAKFLIALVFFILSLAVISVGLAPYNSNVREGDVATETIYAPFDFFYPSKVDEAKMLLLKQKDSESVAPIYDTVDDVVPKMYAAVEESNAAVREALNEKELGAYRQNVTAALGLVYGGYVLDRESKRDLLAARHETIVARNPKMTFHKTIRVGDILTKDDIRKKLEGKIEGLFAKDPRLGGIVTESIARALKPNLAFNEQETNNVREAAARAVAPIYEMQEVKKGETVMQKGQRITKAHIAMLKEINRFEGRTNVASYMTGIAFVLIIFIATFYICLRFSDPKFVGNLKFLGIVSLLSLAVIAVCKAAILAPIPTRIVPFACVPMLLAILVSANAAVIATVLLSIVAGIIFGGKFDIMLIFLVSSLVGVYAMRNLRSRFQIVMAGLGVGLSSSAVVISLSLMSNLKPSVYLIDVGWGVGNGIFSCFLVMGLLPILEYVFKLSSNITLLELSDMSHPLLKELSIKAPGTYLHSHLVGNLSEAACEEIGANALLARIGSYYHDIGKIEKAEYFSENETSYKSKHERLKPSMSSLVIGNHVKEGVELAKRHHLNRQILDIIQQHHGTSLMYFFYKRALENVGESGALKEQDYRYPGPKPQTKEAAAVLLADSVEASSRTLGEPTPGKIRNMVQRIINNKFIDNQLDECNLTLRDLTMISDAFVRVLIAAFHVRAEYPKKEEINPVGKTLDSEPS